MLLIRPLALCWVCLCLAACSKSNEQKTSGTIWHIDPLHGSDQHSGRSADQAWKSFTLLNETELKSGDIVIIAPGRHTQSLVPKAKGTREAPVHIRFLPGLHEFGVEHATRRSYYISNSCAAPEKPMPIGILVKQARHLNITGGGTSGPNQTTLMMAGRMAHFINDHAESILYQNLVFDLKRPTVSEFRVIRSGKDWSEIQIAERSTYQFENGVFTWTGDIGTGRVLTQEAIPAEGRAWRAGLKNNPLEDASEIRPLGKHRFRLQFEDRPPLKPGHQFQFRRLFRDVVGAHNNRSKNISILDCEFHALAGMGIISQFTENIHYERVDVVPPKDTLRTCPAWADGFHFSGCRGQINILDCNFSGTQDDPVNVHGTHLRIVESPAPHQLVVEFVHQQTYGFAAFQEGDEIAVIHPPTLREHPDNPHRKVTRIERLSDRKWRLDLDGQVPHFEANDVVDNLSWYPDVTIKGCHVEMDPTRGFLITTRGKVLVENNTFHRCNMPAILIEGDASGWFESGPVRDMLIRNNTFIDCDIRIHPRVKAGNAPVHENIRIIGNTFREGAAIEGHHASGLAISHNRSEDGKLSIKLDPESTSAVITDNE